MKVYIGEFKQKANINEEGYLHLQLGADKNQYIKDNLDNSGENISLKNPNYCELTGLFWIWKNVKADIVGLVHYRRFFYNSSFILSKKKILTSKQVQKIMIKKDIIVPKKEYILFSNVYKQYEKFHDITDLEKCGSIIKEKYPDYFDSFNKVMNSNNFYGCNMIIAKKEILNEYCKWLFDILFELEEQIDISKKDDYNKRVFGFLSERLFNVWLLKNNYNIQEKPVFNISLSFAKQCMLRIIKRILCVF